MYCIIPQAPPWAAYHQTWTMAEDPGHGKQELFRVGNASGHTEIWSLIPHSEEVWASAWSIDMQYAAPALLHFTLWCTVIFSRLPALLTVGIVPGTLEWSCSREEDLLITSIDHNWYIQKSKYWYCVNKHPFNCFCFSRGWLWLRGRARLSLSGQFTWSAFQRYWTLKCSWCAGQQHLAWQPAPSVYECTYELL